MGVFTALYNTVKAFMDGIFIAASWNIFSAAVLLQGHQLGATELSNNHPKAKALPAGYSDAFINILMPGLIKVEA